MSSVECRRLACHATTIWVEVARRKKESPRRHSMEKKAIKYFGDFRARDDENGAKKKIEKSEESRRIIEYWKREEEGEIRGRKEGEAREESITFPSLLPLRGSFLAKRVFRHKERGLVL